MYRSSEKSILSVRISSRPVSDVLKDIDNRIAKKNKFLIVTPNPEAVVLADKDPDFRGILNSAEISVADGIGLKLAVKNLDIIKGRELFLEILKIADKKRWKIILVGDQKGSAQKAAKKLKVRFPS